MTVMILQGDARDVLHGLLPDHFDCIVTSPPYWGLRDYGCEGQIGLEPALDEYLETMVAVCRELRRVLKPAGTFWLNIGDCYAASGKGGNPSGLAADRLGRSASLIELNPEYVAMARARIASDAPLFVECREIASSERE